MITCIQKTFDSVADPGEGPGGPVPLFWVQTVGGPKETPSPHNSYLKVWIRHYDWHQSPGGGGGGDRRRGAV